MVALSLIRTHWRKLAVVLAVLLAFAFGRYWRPPVEVREIVRVEEVEVEVERFVTEVVHLKDEAQVVTRTIYRDRVLEPDGTERSSERIDEHLASRTVAASSFSTSLLTLRLAEQRVEHVRTVTPAAPDWRVSALVGADLSAPLSKQSLLYGAHVERRVVGPVSVGAWGLFPRAAAGLSLSIEF